ncbi:hypothetical protein [Catenulispora acidiphila]|uniref:hypothetical protein n=1 Tax=Catenulispora acidiphila TaxID=304895 RepID=UPI00019DEC56|nr:hypothetical protein [Catenulispora acidiphila]
MRFARALAAKDRTALRACLADSLDFQALTPGRSWRAGTPEELIEQIILGRWFGPGDDIRELRSVVDGSVVGRGHVAYLVLVNRADGDYLVEQQAYYDVQGDHVQGDRISWMRVLCSGYQALGDARA